jgi:hypothetical protein
MPDPAEQPDESCFADVVAAFEKKSDELRNENIGLKALLHKCYDQQKTRIEQYHVLEAKWQRVSLERDAIKEDLTRFKLLIEFLQRYVLDEL